MDVRDDIGHADDVLDRLPSTDDFDAPPAQASLEPGELFGDLGMGEQNAIMRAMLDAALDIVIVHTVEGRLVYFNDAACEMLGYTRDELTHLPAYGWVGPDMMGTAPARLEAIVHKGQLTFQTTTRRRDGSMVPAEVKASRLDSRFGPLIVAVIRDISDRIEANQAIMHMAYHDKLTGLGNRALFDDRIEMAMADARRFGDVLAVAFVDVDDFKPVNDRHGHTVGDYVLVELGRRIQDSTRRQDTVVRLGGDEFVVILPRIGDITDLAAVGSKLSTAIRQPFLIPDGPPVELVASIGLAVFDPSADDTRSLLMKADAAMYASKDDPRRDWRIYDDDLYGPLAEQP